MLQVLSLGGDPSILIAANNPVRARFALEEALPEFFKALVNIAFAIREGYHQLPGTMGAQLTGSTGGFQPAVTFLLFDGLLLAKIALAVLLVRTHPQVRMPQS